jgi:hypothetical protein
MKNFLNLSRNRVQWSVDMKVEGTCPKHGPVHGGTMVSRAVYDTWQNGEPWNDQLFITIEHMGFYLEPAPFLVTREEYEPLKLPMDRVLNNEGTERFLDWADDRTVIMYNCCFSEWIGHHKKLSL